MRNVRGPIQSIDICSENCKRVLPKGNLDINTNIISLAEIEAKICVRRKVQTVEQNSAADYYNWSSHKSTSRTKSHLQVYRVERNCCSRMSLNNIVAHWLERPFLAGGAVYTDHIWSTIAQPPTRSAKMLFTASPTLLNNASVAEDFRAPEFLSA